MEELSLDGALKYDGRDVGAALPSEVWVTSGDKRTFRAWSEGNRCASPPAATRRRRRRAPSSSSSARPTWSGTC